MSMGFDTDLLGVMPPPESCDGRGKRLKLEPELKLISEPEIPSESCDERGKRLKSESELESESESESESELESASDSEPEPFPKWDYRTKPFKDLVYEDFSSRYDDHPQPYIFGCARFVYRNKAQIKIDEEEAKALADYLRDSANISPFDAIPVPPLANKCGNNFPRPITTTMTDDCRDLLIQLSKLALIKFNDENNQVSKYQFHNIVKATCCRIPLTTYYITFEATKDAATHVFEATKDAATHVDPVNITTFQAHVWSPLASKGPPAVRSCAIKN